MAVFDSELSDAVLTAQVEDVVRAVTAISQDPIGIGEIYIALYGMVTSESVTTADGAVANQIGNASLADVVNLVEAIYLGRQESLSDGVGVNDSAQLQWLVILLEALGLAGSAEAAARYRIGLVQGIKLLDSLAQFFGADVLETLGVGESLLANALKMSGLVDAITIQEAVTPTFLLSVTAADAIRITPADAVRMLFNPTLEEGVEISAGFIAPNGSFTTWAMNTRSGAVTEYDNFAFNSFGTIGGRYYGASDQGLYELLGDDDDGADIIGTIKGGLMQFGGTQLSRLKEAYIAVRNGGGFVLKITTGDGLSYTYGVDARSMRSTKVHMGKGQRARYFAYELTSLGQDFDLDTLEFVPIVVQRRV